MYCVCLCCFFFFMQKTAYEMRISDWSSDVCSSDLFGREDFLAVEHDQLVRFGPVERDAAPAEAVVAIDAAIFGDHAARESGIVAQLFERISEHRHPILARNMVDRSVWGARHPVPRVGSATSFGPCAVCGMIGRAAVMGYVVQYCLNLC